MKINYFKKGEINLNLERNELMLITDLICGEIMDKNYNHYDNYDREILENLRKDFRKFLLQ